VLKGKRQKAKDKSEEMVTLVRFPLFSFAFCLSPWPRLAFCLLPFLSLACQRPSQANIELRRQNAELREQVAELRRQREGDQATIKSLESRATTVPSLPGERLDQLFTTHGLTLGKLTGGVDLDADKPGDEALRVIATPTDQSGQSFKAAGAFTIELFDLAGEGQQRIGRWEFTTEQARERWLGSALVSAYVFELPWQEQPAHEQLTVKVAFTDELTGRVFSEQKVVRVKRSGASE
jgi:hypothetical protein